MTADKDGKTIVHDVLEMESFNNVKQWLSDVMEMESFNVSTMVVRNRGKRVRVTEWYRVAMSENQYNLQRSPISKVLQVFYLCHRKRIPLVLN
ncbi:hypothetical protein Sjap_013312 [Stephania japonica]|uniref:Uncharacterized protein n=1 Tax=Stephania japonica TaxID=461633 RepID=A0AAP0IYG9_9MAGN